jgi:RNA polymerase sigma factor (sigma-70 family)
VSAAGLLPPPALRLLGDERLAALAAAGDDSAFAALYARHHAALLRYCRSIVRDEHDALDALQSAMLKALVALRRDGRNAPLRPWLYRIAHNESISLLRRSRTRAAGEGIEEVAAHADVHERAADREELAQALADLDALTVHQRSALVLRELGGLGYGEVATALDTTPGAARQAVFSARTALHDRRDARDVTCTTVQRTLSDDDARARPVRAHLRTCDDCRRFAAGIKRRRTRLPLLFPVPAGAMGRLQSLLPAAAESGSPMLAGGAAKLAVAAIAVGAAAAGGDEARHERPAKAVAPKASAAAPARTPAPTSARAPAAVAAPPARPAVLVRAVATPPTRRVSATTRPVADASRTARRVVAGTAPPRHRAGRRVNVSWPAGDDGGRSRSAPAPGATPGDSDGPRRPQDPATATATATAAEPVERNEPAPTRAFAARSGRDCPDPAELIADGAGDQMGSALDRQFPS